MSGPAAWREGIAKQTDLLYGAAMPKGPQGQKRPADVIGNAIRIARIATGEEQETPEPEASKVRAGKAGADARAAKLTEAERQHIAEKASQGRWGSKK